MLLLPGLIDVHSDALEKERAPRPSAVLPWDFVLGSFADKLAAAGVLTMFHGAGFQHKQARGVIREPGAALALCRQVTGHPGGSIRHRILHRLDVLREPGAETLRAWLAERTDDGVPPLVSHEDHTPGQGQYVDPEHMVTYIVGADGKSPEEARAQVERLRAEAADKQPVRRANLAWLGELARAGAIRLMGHDPDSPGAIAELVERGSTVAEFPTTLAAARAAREVGLLIVAGAPNVLRGGSHNGNVSATELAHAGLLDALASDYLPTALLGSVSVLAPELGLPAAVGFVTGGPARVAGLPDGGTLAGRRAGRSGAGQRRSGSVAAGGGGAARSPARTGTVIVLPSLGRGQVAYSVNANHMLMVRLKSSTTVPSASGSANFSCRQAGVSESLVGSWNSMLGPALMVVTTSRCG